MLTQTVPKVAVALAAYNGVAYLAQQMDSILQQAGVDVTVFISVDASSDGTEAWCTELAGREPRVVLLPTGQRFGAAAPNFLRLLRELRLDGFDYLAFADQDDIWLADKLLRAHQQLLAQSAQAYSSNVTAFWPSGRQLLVDKAQPQRAWDHLFEAAGPGCTYVLTHALALAVQDSARRHQAALAPLNYHDWFIYALARIHGHRWHIDPQPGVLYRQHAGNQVGVNSGLASFRRRVATVRSGEAWRQARLIARVAGLASEHPVQRLFNGGRLGMLRLACAAGRCRRKPMERVYFFFSCLAAALWPPDQEAAA